MRILIKISPQVFWFSMLLACLLHVGCSRPTDIADIADANACTVIIGFEDNISKSQKEEIRAFLSNGAFLENAIWIETVTSESVMNSKCFAQCIFSFPAKGDRTDFFERKKMQIHNLLAEMGIKNYRIEAREKKK